jgi:enoyl-CoA hydratase/carnithine racemase
MGGGTEISLACRYRVASGDPSTRIGLPEVKLGIFPGWGGTARLPRLIGAPAAMDLMLTGRTVGQGARDRLVDKVVARRPCSTPPSHWPAPAAPVQAARYCMGQQHMAGAQAAGAADAQAGGAQGEEGPVPGAVRADRPGRTPAARASRAVSTPSAAAWSSWPVRRPRAT